MSFVFCIKFITIVRKHPAIQFYKMSKGRLHHKDVLKMPLKELCSIGFI